MTFEEAKQEARARWGRVSAYRVGRVVGESDSELLNPYVPGSQGADMFARGFVDGLEFLRRKQERGDA